MISSGNAIEDRPAKDETAVGDTVVDTGRCFGSDGKLAAIAFYGARPHKIEH